MSSDRIAVCQFESDIGDIKSNIEKIENIVKQLPDETHIAVFPELCLSGYHLRNIKQYAQNIPSEATDSIQDIAEAYDINIVVGLPEQADDRLYNSVVLIDESGVRDTYRKQYPTGGELDAFTPSDGITIVETSVAKLGFLICYDMSFPEAMLEYAEEECDVVIVSSAWRKGWHDDWRVLAQARALESTAYLVASNAKGYQKSRHNGGESLIVSPKGNILVNLKDTQEFGTVEFDEELLTDAREEYNPVLGDRKELSQFRG